MATIVRHGEAVWKGGLRKGNGRMGTESTVLSETPYSFSTRFENEPGTNPEELIAAAHAACYSMAFAGFLERQGYEPQSIETRAAISMERRESGFVILKTRLHVRGQGPGLDAGRFEELAHEADKGCPVSNLLRNGLEIEIETELL